MQSSSDWIKAPNSLNTVRLLAACQVLLLHISDHFVLPVWLQPVHHLLNLIPGVPVFFMLSGFLIWHSIETSGSYSVYLKKRAVRIYPELWISVILELLCLIFLYDQPVPILELLAFAFGQATVFQFWKPDSLLGYGCGTPNGSLWTIPVMVTFYVLVWWLHRVLHGKKAAVWAWWFAGAVGLSFLVTAAEGRIPDLCFKLLQYSLVPYFWLFFIGIYTAEHIQKLLPFLKKYWGFCLFFLILWGKSGWYLPTWEFDPLNSILLFGVCLGFAYGFPKLRVPRDISYALYIYHMLAVNALISLFGTSASWLSPAAILISFLLATGSTFLVSPLTRKLRKRILQ